MTKYQREGDWLVEVSDRQKPWRPIGRAFLGEEYSRYKTELETYTKHLSSLKRLRISPELAAHLGGRMEVGEDEIEVKERCNYCGNIGRHSVLGKRIGKCVEFELTAYPKLIDGGKEIDNVTYWNQMKTPLIEQIQRHDWRNALEIIHLLNAKFNKL